MFKKRVPIYVALAIVLATVLAGCGQPKVAEINGQVVSGDDFVNYMRAQVGVRALAQMLDDQLTLQIAKDQGVEPTDEQVQKRLDTFSKLTDIYDQLAENGATKDDLKAQFVVVQAKTNIAVKMFGKEITEDEIKEAYEQKGYDLPERTKAEIVLFMNEKAAKEASKKIKSGKTLEEIGAESGEDHQAMGSMVIPKSGPEVLPEIAKAAFDTPMDKVSEPIKVDGPTGEPAWVLLQPLKKIAAVKISLDEAKEVIRGELALRKAYSDKDYMKLFEDARRDAKVTIDDKLMKQAEKAFRQMR